MDRRRYPRTEDPLHQLQWQMTIAIGKGPSLKYRIASHDPVLHLWCAGQINGP